MSELRPEGRVRLSQVRGIQKGTVGVDRALNEDMSCRLPGGPGHPGCRGAAGEAQLKQGRGRKE